MRGSWRFQGMYNMSAIQPLFDFLREVASQRKLDCLVREDEAELDERAEYHRVFSTKVQDLQEAIKAGSSWRCQWDSKPLSPLAGMITNKIWMTGQLAKQYAEIGVELDPAERTLTEHIEFPVTLASVGVEWTGDGDAKFHTGGKVYPPSLDAMKTACIGIQSKERW